MNRLTTWLGCFFLILSACAGSENGPALREGLALGAEGPDVVALRSFLASYGYLHQVNHHGYAGRTYAIESLASKDDVFDAPLEAALKLYQDKQGLVPSGAVDGATVVEMGALRCGVGDFDSSHMHAHEAHHDAAAYKLLGGKRWPKRRLTYCFDNFTADLSESEIRAEVANAYSQWAEASGLEFFEVPAKEKCDLRISWEDNDHGDGHPFILPNGGGRTLAHGFPPSCRGKKCSKLSGDIHLSRSCKWVVRGGDGLHRCDLRSSFLHEVGHTLGLDHTNVKNSAMVPTYTGQATLGQDDILGIKALYEDLETEVSGSGLALRGADGSVSGGCQVGGSAPIAGFGLPFLAGMALILFRARRRAS